MKKYLLTVMFLAFTIMSQGQENTPFEGEIVYETYENYSDYILKMPNSIYYEF